MLARAERLHRELFRPARSGSRMPLWEPPVDVIETELSVVRVLVQHSQRIFEDCDSQVREDFNRTAAVLCSLALSLDQLCVDGGAVTVNFQRGNSRPLRESCGHRAPSATAIKTISVSRALRMAPLWRGAAAAQLAVHKSASVAHERLLRSVTSLVSQYSAKYLKLQNDSSYGWGTRIRT